MYDAAGRPNTARVRMRTRMLLVRAPTMVRGGGGSDGTEARTFEWPGAYANNYLLQYSGRSRGGWRRGARCPLGIYLVGKK